jgi:hypothetical protein
MSDFPAPLPMLMLLLILSLDNQHHLKDLPMAQ